MASKRFLEAIHSRDVEQLVNWDAGGRLRGGGFTQTTYLGFPHLETIGLLEILRET